MELEGYDVHQLGSVIERLKDDHREGRLTDEDRRDLLGHLDALSGLCYDLYHETHTERAA